jgi:hypothetical protein
MVAASFKYILYETWEKQDQEYSPGFLLLEAQNIFASNRSNAPLNWRIYNYLVENLAAPFDSMNGILDPIHENWHLAIMIHLLKPFSVDACECRREAY